MKLHKLSYTLLALVSAFALCLLLITISVVRQRQTLASSQSETSYPKANSSAPDSEEESALVSAPGWRSRTAPMTLAYSSLKISG